MIGNRLVIGVDYGTTYTGVAFCETTDTTSSESLIQVIQDWPAAHTMIGTKDKVPSEIAYINNEVLWGSKIPTHIPRYMWTKLDLDTSKSGEAACIRNEVEYLQRSPVQVVADYLSKVREHLIKVLDTRFGPALWGSLPITLVITVPAIWSDGAKSRTMQAFHKAGFSKATFPQLKRTITTTEPEAAAIYTLKSMRGSVQHDQLKVEDGFVVCDMGGGTVDLISYRISGTDPLTVEEITIGSGDQCGGSFVDREFIIWLQDRLGLEYFEKIAGGPAATCSRTCLPQKLARMVQEFILSAKSGFSGTEEFYLRLPAALSGIDDWTRGMSDGELHVEAADIKLMFESCLKKTRHLIADQVASARRNKKASIKFVFFVGGFAESPYMFHELKNFCEILQLQAIKPAYAWSAIVRGAAAKGLEGDGNPVLVRKCRRNYGTDCSEIFVPSRHLESDAYIDPYTGQKRASHQMIWLIKKGGDLQTSKEVHATTSLNTRFWVNERSTVFLDLLACDEDHAPAHSYHRTLYRVARLSFSTESIPTRFLSKKVSPDGKLYFSATSIVHISIQSAIEFSVTVNGNDFGSVIVDYD